ncbi:MAG: chemotaxis protein CheD [Pyrinomonadaceae bacterium]
MKHIVGIADMKVSSNPDDEIITYALGSCLGVTVFDPVAGVAGMIHIMLPSSNTNPEKARENPYMFVDTGIPALFKACYKLGADKSRMMLKVAGGASRHDAETDNFQIGKRNMLVLKKLLWKNNVLIDSQDVGDKVSRTMALRVKDGTVTLKINNEEKPL